MIAHRTGATREKILSFTHPVSTIDSSSFQLILFLGKMMKGHRVDPNADMHNCIMCIFSLLPEVMAQTFCRTTSITRVVPIVNMTCK